MLVTDCMERSDFSQICNLSQKKAPSNRGFLFWKLQQGRQPRLTSRTSTAVARLHHGMVLTVLLRNAINDINQKCKIIVSEPYHNEPRLLKMFNY